ncbi:MAG TPA: right-handed parallel beta-helix repeat-containing protein [Microbacteriaceae bacterium]|nr:right-handed parallel beta-helix repeat-containing protein [Microbacteriaceae bacterium]
MAAAIGAAVLTASLLTAGAADAAPPSPACVSNAGGTGLSAAVVAKAHQTISNRTIRTNCDIGIYVGQGATAVRIKHVTVSGAHYQGIFAEKTSHLLIDHSSVHGNGFQTVDPSAPALEGSGVHSYVGEAFGISLFGVSDSFIWDNSVYHNGRGGIGIMDNGANDPGLNTKTASQNKSAPLISSTNDVITGNRMWGNYTGCGLVAATQNLGGSLSNLVLSNNTITGTGLSKTRGPDVGGLIVAANTPGSKVSNVSVSGNKVTGSAEGGIVVNAEAPTSPAGAGAATSNVWITNNTVTRNNLFGLTPEPKTTVGVVVFSGGPGATNTGTVVAQNRISQQNYGIWSNGSTTPTTLFNQISVTRGGTDIYHQG